MPIRSVVTSTSRLPSRILEAERLCVQIVDLPFRGLVARGVAGHPDRFGGGDDLHRDAGLVRVFRTRRGWAANQ